MLAGHNPSLVALSVVIAILGGYTGFGMAARVRGTTVVGQRFLLAGAALFLAVGIWTMHFVGMLAVPLPDDAVYLVLPTIVSFLICAIVVGVSLFFVSMGEPSSPRIVAAALLLGTGIVSMHYVGIHGLAGDFGIEHDVAPMVAAALVALGAGYGGLRVFIARQGGARLATSAVAFGIAVSGMHYTAMYGMRFVPAGTHMHTQSGPVASPQVLSLVVALLCFLIVAGFLLFLVPEPRSRSRTSPASPYPAETVDEAEAGLKPTRLLAAGASAAAAVDVTAASGTAALPGPPPLAARLPVEATDGTHFIEVAEVRSIRADAHYSLVHDGSRERMSPWSISHAEAQLDPTVFVRVHRSHIIALPHVMLIRKEGDGAVVELAGPTPHLVPVSRAKIAELKARLGLIRRSA
ncbi:MAG: LytTR family transcriptional regulator DNA-binding domain-containing protein [Rhizobiaceae bacterium]|nr:LytTR family transcriptional regulator DNA-binding domain-containing protein [Rhizobiaceae bacterium]